MQEDFAYRAYFNRSRTVIFLHPSPHEIADLIDAFQEQGFITNLAVTLGSLERLTQNKTPDAIVAFADGNQVESQAKLLRELVRGSRLYILTDDVPALAEVVRAVRSGALCLFARPYRVTDILREVEHDLAPDLRQGPRRVEVGGMGSLTAREREVLDIILGGGSNKDAAQTLHISPRTIEVHRASVMKKLGAKNAAAMVRIALSK